MYSHTINLWVFSYIEEVGRIFTSMVTLVVWFVRSFHKNKKRTINSLIPFQSAVSIGIIMSFFLLFRRTLACVCVFVRDWFLMVCGYFKRWMLWQPCFDGRWGCGEFRVWWFYLVCLNQNAIHQKYN